MARQNPIAIAIWYQKEVLDLPQHLSKSQEQSECPKSLSKGSHSLYLPSICLSYYVFLPQIEETTGDPVTSSPTSPVGEIGEILRSHHPPHVALLLNEPRDEILHLTDPHLALNGSKKRRRVASRVHPLEEGGEVWDV